MKKTLISLLAGLAILSNVNSQSLKPTGEIDVSLIPYNTSDIYGIRNSNVKEAPALLKTRLKAGVDITFNKEFSSYLFAAETTYSLLPSGSIYFKPLIQGYDLGAGLRWNDLEFYIFHNCTHPVNDNKTIWASFDGIIYDVNNTAITEIGVKYKF